MIQAERERESPKKNYKEAENDGVFTDFLLIVAYAKLAFILNESSRTNNVLCAKIQDKNRVVCPLKCVKYDNNED